MMGKTYTAARGWISHLLRDLEAAPSGPRFRFVRWVLVPLVVITVLTAFGRFTGFDLGAEKAIYQAGGDSWAFGEIGFWHGIYEYGTMPATVLVLASVVGYILSWSRERFRKWRRVFLYVFLTLAISSGVITNFILKEYWGRPRPKQLLVTGGYQEFEPVLTYDPSSKGKSFPCGHATMGFFFLGGFFLLRRYRRGLAWGLLVFGLVFGSLLGLARMTQGGHFFTDVVWAGAVCWFTPLGLYYALKLDRALTGNVSEKPMPLWLKLATGLLAIGMVAGILLGSPYREKRDLYILEEFAQTGGLDVNLTFAVGRVEIVDGEKLHIAGEAWGHGVPTSDIGEFFVVSDRKPVPRAVYFEDLGGWFAEIESELKVELPWHRLRRLMLRLGMADVQLNVPAFVGDRRISVGKGKSDLKMSLHGQEIVLKNGDLAKLKSPDGSIHEGDKANGRIVLDLTEDFEGEVVILSSD